ncbi:CpsD/CapB family tyrosine-protein kinase [Evansella halocellulosilytica]|uniref:CpsD/CapB family tyrosine-protein kinase n=1 Tax=Evansella halocellulosilytica TaxID=2011013 RepID=UPI0015CD1D66|nr:CpsD/CapB family tyrosine-protein kinase [Evansella halocellulosilytica]
MVSKALKKNVTSFYQNPESTISEEFKRIKVNIEFAAFENKSKTILITSPNKSEGKTMITAKLAITLSREGKKVLLIDSSIHNPTLHKVFKIKNNEGLTNVIAGQRKLKDTINQTMIDDLKILTVGQISYNIEKLYHSTSMDEVLTEAVKDFDFVLIDSSPVHEGNMTKIIANKCDGVIMVVRSHKTEDILAQEAKKVLEISKSKLIGIILNAKPRSMFKYFRNK